jgi:MSHA pilin protein MshC
MVVKAAIPLFFARTIVPASTDPHMNRRRGFTLMELVAVIAIVAVLSISATAMFSKSSFDTARFARELESVLAFAQKSAVAQRRSVTVSVASAAVSASICSTFDPCGAASALVLPTQAGGSLLAVPSGVTLSATVDGAASALPLTVTFTPRGGLSTPAAGAVVITASGEIGKSVRIEHDTGYVYALP